MELIPNTGKKAIKNKAHYSSAVVFRDLVFVSGQLPYDANGEEIILDSFENQCRAVLDNLKSVLKRANSDLSLVIKTTIYISDVKLWPSANEIYANYFGSHRPARVIVPLSGKMHYGADIEIEAIAIKKQ